MNRIVMVGFRRYWSDDGGVILLEKIFVGIHGYILLLGNVIAGG